jgi:CO/xanthine dehydrogenase FAD-binding subunit
LKPAPFEYLAPRSVDEALSQLGDDVAPLAGGQSLVPLLNFRLARPAVIVDLNGIDSLAGLGRDDASGALRIGAMTRQAAVERSELVADGWSLLRQAVRFAGHPQTRSRGTVGGSVAHADPAAELPAALLALDAVFHLRSASGSRTVSASDFFVGPLTTVLEPGELLVEIEVPALPAGARTAFVEHARTHGDFATAGAAVVLGPNGAGAAIAVLGVEGKPTRVRAAEYALRGGASFREVADLISASARDDYRRALVTELVVRALTDAAGGSRP